MSSRRTFITDAAICGAGVAWATSVGLTSGCLRAEDGSDRESALFEFAEQTGFASRVGMIYLREDPVGRAERSKQRLTEQLLANLGPDPGNLNGELESQVMADFVQGHTCEIDGWILSRTECRLAALAFISRGSVVDDERTEMAARIKKKRLPFADIPVLEFAELGNWGPQSGGVKKPFNLQPDGRSALWLRFPEMEQDQYELYFDGIRMRTLVSKHKGIISASLTATQALAATSVPGKKAIYLVDVIGQRKQRVGHFMVE